MQKVLKGILSFGLAAVLCLGVTTAVYYAADEAVVADAATDYYASITASNGNALLGQVHDLITTTHTRYTTYNDCKDPAYVKKTDPGTGGALMEFYAQADLSSTWQSGVNGTWNREHVWCQSLSNGLWGQTGGGSDLLHIRPTESRVNNARGNNKYGVSTTKTEVRYRNASNEDLGLAGYRDGSSVFEPIDTVKGDVARIVLYVYTHYNTYTNVYGSTNGKGSSSYFGTLKFTNVMAASNETAAIEMLLDWHNSDPVDEIEITRNDVVYEIQGNRNPFVDHPEYVDAIWGDGTIGGKPPVSPERLTLNKTALTLSTGRSETLTVTAYPEGASSNVNWTSSDEKVATVSAEGKVTAVSVGTATITAASKSNPAIKATAQVTVEPSGYLTATITLDSFNLSYGYGFKTWSAGDLSGVAYIYGGSSSYPAENRLQFNKNQPSYYLASSTEAEGGIRSITVKSYEGTADRDWKLLTSDTAYGQVTGKPTNGTDHGTKTVTSEGVTWTLDGSDTYFALTYEFPSSGTSAAAYLDSIIVEYGDGTKVPVPPTPQPDQEKLDAFHAAVESIVTEGTLKARLESINKAIGVYQTLSDLEKEAAKEDIAALQAAIADYNETVNSLNADSDSANAGFRGKSNSPEA